MSTWKWMSLATLLCGCPDALDTPVAIIAAGSSLDAEETPAVCQESASDVSATANEAAAIHGACSRDANGLTVRYRWSLVDQPSGSKMEIVNDETASPTIIPDMEGRYKIELVVSNGTLTSKPAVVTLNVGRQ